MGKRSSRDDRRARSASFSSSSSSSDSDSDGSADYARSRRRDDDDERKLSRHKKSHRKSDKKSHKKEKRAKSSSSRHHDKKKRKTKKARHSERVSGDNLRDDWKVRRCACVLVCQRLGDQRVVSCVCDNGSCNGQRAHVVVNEMLREFPELRGEFVGLLQMLNGGGVAVISGIENKRIRSQLKELFPLLQLTKVRSCSTGGYRLELID